MFRKKRFGLLGFLLAVILITVLLTVTAFSTENAVYISVSYDGRYIEDKNGSPIANIAVPLDELAAIDLNDYCLSEYSCDNDHDGKTDITALQLVIYAHENIYGGDWSDVAFSGSPGSSYFEGGIFGFSENLNYYLNGQYPLAGEGWGATSDQIVLSAGDFLDIASFSSWDFYQDSAFGFFYFTDENGDITHSYEAKVETPLTIKLVKGTKDYEYNSVIYEMADCEVFYGTAYGDAMGSVFTDGSGCAEIAFDSAGEWFLWVNGAYGSEYPDSIVSAPGYACVEVEANESTSAPDESLDISGILNDTMANLAKTVSEPAFGTDAGEWTVLSLARGGYYSKNSEYFSDYYGRIVEIVNSKAAEVDSNGALHKNKSTDNSRLIVALSSIGKDATSVGNWDITAPYSDFSWIKNQGINGVIWALIALDSNDYKTTDSTIRQQCVDAILDSRHNDGGWALTANKDYASDPDITAMALQALYPYRTQPEVKTACEEAFELLSELQHQNGIFSSDGSECAESCAQVIIACTTWGIDPDTDSRFVKGENSVVDGLLAHYIEDSNSFEHIIGAGENGMATDQACCALVAYSRFLNSENSLYDFGDVEFEAEDTDKDEETDEKDEIKAYLSLPSKIEGKAGTTFNAVLSVKGWDNDSAYKMIDYVVSAPSQLEVTAVESGKRLSGGEVVFNSEILEDGSQKLRVVYFDANNNSDLMIDGDEERAELFTIKFKVKEPLEQFDIFIDGMSVKTSSDSLDEGAMNIVDTKTAYGSVAAVNGISYSAVCLYTGDDIDLIPSDKKAVALAVTGIDGRPEITYDNGGKSVGFSYSREITEKTGVSCYVAMVDDETAMEDLVNAEYFTIGDDNAPLLTFGDHNADGAINAQDALAAVDFWLRKTEITSDSQILAMNVNGDSRLNTFDALGIVEAFVNDSEYAVIANAATLNA